MTPMRAVRWVREWWETLQVLRDPLSRQTLLSRHNDDDYVEVRRPEGEAE